MTEITPKDIRLNGVVVVTDYADLPPSYRDPETGAATYTVLAYHDTTGNLVQFREEDIPSGVTFDERQHRDMDLLYAHRAGGTVVVTYWREIDGAEHEVTLGPRGTVFIPSGIRHNVRNHSDGMAYITAIGTRSGVVAERDRTKGRNIPRPPKAASRG